MTHNSPEVTIAMGTPPRERIVDLVLRGLGLSSAVPVQVSEVDEFSNINYVYRVQILGRSFYVKMVPARAKRFAASMPRERVFSEAEGLRRFRRLAGGLVLIPEVLFVDTQEMALAMTDVGEGREVLFTVLRERFDLLAEQADALGQALGAIHGGTRGTGILRPAQEEAIIRGVIFEGLLAPGARQVFPGMWDAVSAEMQSHKQCLMHADLWSKNLLVRAGQPVALVDFEGVCYGDPAFDLATLMTVAILPALETTALLFEALAFTSRLLSAWASACGDDAWPAEVWPRAFHATACFLAARGFGPFAYSMNDLGRRRIGNLARSLAEEPPITLEAFRSRVASLSIDSQPRPARPPENQALDEAG
jgi:tRNA A-37 threonylcarbamoyl transferase component Bud32